MAARSMPYLPFNPSPSRPRARLPAGACDTHFHVFAPAFPLAEPRSYTPLPAEIDRYLAMASTVGIDRAVLVHPSVYGADHASFEATLAAHGHWMRGVAVAGSNTPEATLAHWHALGARGTRINALFAGGTAVADLRQIVPRIAHLNWHVQVLIDIAAQPRMVEQVADLGVAVVVDHLGHFPLTLGTREPGFQNLLRLAREGRAWVKLSGAYRLSQRAPDYPDLRPLVDALVEAAPAQLLWGTDWPHPAIAPPMPDDGKLADLLFDWLDVATRTQVLVDNPTRLYWAD